MTKQEWYSSETLAVLKKNLTGSPRFWRIVFNPVEAYLEPQDGGTMDVRQAPFVLHSVSRVHALLLNNWRNMGGVRSFALFNCWYMPDVLGFRHSVGVLVCNFGIEFHFGRN